MKGYVARVDRYLLDVTVTVSDDSCRRQEVVLSAETEAGAVAAEAALRETLRRLHDAQCSIYEAFARLSGVKRDGRQEEERG